MKTSKVLGYALAGALTVGAVPVFAAETAKAPAADTKAEEKEPFGRLTVDEVEKGIASKELYLFDNNSKDRWQKGHVPGARWVDFTALTEKDLPADKAAKLVFYCGSEKCMACHGGAKAALKLGYKNVFIMPAGIAGWEKAGKKLEPGT